MPVTKEEKHAARLARIEEGKISRQRRIAKMNRCKAKPEQECTHEVAAEVAVPVEPVAAEEAAEVAVPVEPVAAEEAAEVTVPVEPVVEVAGSE
jgi:hypothetical protein